MNTDALVEKHFLLQDKHHRIKFHLTHVNQDKTISDKVQPCELGIKSIKHR